MFLRLRSGFRINSNAAGVIRFHSGQVFPKTFTIKEIEEGTGGALAAPKFPLKKTLNSFFYPQKLGEEALNSQAYPKEKGCHLFLKSQPESVFATPQF